MSESEVVTVLDRLKTETHALHLEVEQTLPLGRPDLSLAQYGAVLQVFDGVVSPLEERLLALNLPASFGLEERLRADLLRRDLADLGLAAGRAGQDWRALSRAQAPGALYVLEGSRLGGALIARQLAHLGLDAGHGARYFAPSARLAAQWKEFRAALLSEVPPGDEDAVIAGAELTYRAFISAWRLKGETDMVLG